MAWRILVVLACLSVSAQAQTYRLRVTEDERTRANATACCVGHTDDGAAVLVTARHNIRRALKIEIRCGDTWYRCRLVQQHSDADVAVIEAEGATLKSFTRIRKAKSRERVKVGGFGGEYHGRTKTSLSAVVDETGDAVLADGQQVVTGDSGGFVAAAADGGPALLGIVSGFDRDNPTHTVIVPADRITECLQRRYRCGPGGCPPVWIRPGVTQPFLGPFPIGPPRPIGIVDPLPPITITTPPPQTTPAPPSGSSGGCSPDAIRQAVADWMDQNGDEFRPRDGIDGARGERGERGADGAPGRSVRAEELNAIVDAWLESNRDSLRGEPGQAGPPGQRGPSGPAGLAGTPGTVDADQIRQLVRTEVEILMAEVADDPKLPLPTDEVTERKRLLYFTSKLGCPACKKTDESVRKLKERGYPVTIIDLNPRETEIKGVPRVYHPSSGRDVLGPQAVADYLASVGY